MVQTNSASPQEVSNIILMLQVAMLLQCYYNVVAMWL